MKIDLSLDNLKNTILPDLKQLLDKKLDVTGYDTEPTSGSSNIMTSGDIYTAIEKCVKKTSLDEITDADIDAMFL